MMTKYLITVSPTAVIKICHSYSIALHICGTGLYSQPCPLNLWQYPITFNNMFENTGLQISQSVVISAAHVSDMRPLVCGFED